MLPKTTRVRKSIDVDVTIDVEDVIEEIADEDLIAELQRRNNSPGSGVSLLTIFEEFQRRGDAPQCLKDYLYAVIGRVL